MPEGWRPEGIAIGDEDEDGQSIVDSRSVRHIAQGVLAHARGRLPCPKKTPRKMWRLSASAKITYRIEI